MKININLRTMIRMLFALREKRGGGGGGKPSFYTYISTYLLSRVFTIIKSSIDPPLSGRIIRLMKMELMKTLNI